MAVSASSKLHAPSMTMSADSWLACSHSDLLQWWGLQQGCRALTVSATPPIVTLAVCETSGPRSLCSSAHPACSAYIASASSSGLGLALACILAHYRGQGKLCSPAAGHCASPAAVVWIGCCGKDYKQHSCTAHRQPCLERCSVLWQLLHKQPVDSVKAETQRADDRSALLDRSCRTQSR